jgi:hypothetical protein
MWRHWNGDPLGALESCRAAPGMELWPSMLRVLSHKTNMDDGAGLSRLPAFTEAMPAPTAPPDQEK